MFRAERLGKGQRSEQSASHESWLAKASREGGKVECCLHDLNRGLGALVNPHGIGRKASSPTRDGNKEMVDVYRSPMWRKETTM